MKKNHVIEFEPRERILEKAKKYVESVELFSEESDQAIAVLLKAVKHAETDLKREIMFVLGTFAKEKVIWPLYDMMTDSSEKEDIRHDAAIQLSVIGPFLKDPQPLVDQLLKEIQSPDPERRLYATLAMGWRGNSPAAIPLIGRLYDADLRVQQMAVNALCNLRDDRILHLLLDRLSQGPLEQKRNILFNLWRFHSKAEEVAEVYLKYLEDENPELRFDALVCMGRVTATRECLDVYRKCLNDKDGRIRELALKRLSETAGDSVLQPMRAEIEALLGDPNMKIKKLAVKMLQKRSK
jgi:HEAT repeat protein